MKREHKIRLGIGIGIIIFIVLLRLSGIGSYFKFEHLKEHRVSLQRMVQERYTRSVFLYIALYAFLIALSIPASALLTVTGGFLFGTLPGLLYTNIGATIGGVLAFLTFRYFMGSIIQRKYKDKLIGFNKAVEEQGTYYLVVVHFLAFVPFVLINILASFTNISLWTFIWTTSVGIIPGSLVYSYAGSQLATIDSIRDIVSIHIIIVFILLGVVAFLPTIVKQLRKLKSY